MQHFHQHDPIAVHSPHSTEAGAESRSRQALYDFHVGLGGLNSKRWCGGHPSAAFARSLAHLLARAGESRAKVCAARGGEGLTRVDTKRRGVTRRRRERDSVKHLSEKSAVAAGSLPSITAAAVIWLNRGNTSRLCVEGKSEANGTQSASCDTLTPLDENIQCELTRSGWECVGEIKRSFLMNMSGGGAEVGLRFGLEKGLFRVQIFTQCQCLHIWESFWSLLHKNLRSGLFRCFVVISSLGIR